MPAQQQHTSYTGYTSASNGPIVAGQCVVLDASGDYYNVSTTAARTAAGRRSMGIAVTGCSGTAQDRAFEVQVVGEIAESITNLGAGTASLIRVSDAGVLERVGEYSTSDDVCGHCDEDGTAHVCFPLVGLGAALGASSAPGLPARSIQYYLDANTLGGAAHASISSDGYIETRAASENVASTGFWRVGYNPGVPVLAALDSGAVNRSLITQNASTFVLGSALGWTTNVEGVGIVFKTKVGSSAVNTMILNAGGTFFNDTAGTQIGQIFGTSMLLAVPRYGQSTAWGASEGEVTVANTGTYSLTSSEYIYASIIFSGAGTGTYTFPAATSARSHVKWLENTSAFDKTITNGGATTYTLKAGTSVWVKFTNNGVFAATSGGKCLVVFTGSAVKNTTTFLDAYGVPQAPESGFTIRSIAVTADDVASAGTYSVQVTIDGTAISPALSFVVTTSTSNGQVALATPHAINAGEAIGVKVVGSSNGEAPNLGFNVTVCLGSAS